MFGEKGEVEHCQKGNRLISKLKRLKTDLRLVVSVDGWGGGNGEVPIVTTAWCVCISPHRRVN